MDIAVRYLIRQDVMTYLRDLRNALVAEARKNLPPIRVNWEDLEAQELACVSAEGWAWINKVTSKAQWQPSQQNYNHMTDELFEMYWVGDPNGHHAMGLLQFLRSNNLKVFTKKSVPRTE